ncbi:right-handed parallel beta-helix repeat-containing protein [Candidatus Micrarchaeota archaeon]|nr:right-handed parallel beta-helix repeat-containing protein [Candidatus Micrarchaeota archaeon]
MRKQAGSISISILTIFILIFLPLGFAENCPIITSAGTYNQTQNYVGAPNDVSASGHACVKIAASNVFFDCGSFYEITGNGTSNSYGIVVDGAYTNVTITSCTISNYSEAGIKLYWTENSTITTTTMSGNGYGVYVVGGKNNSIKNSLATHSSVYGFYLESSDLNNLTYTFVYYSTYDGFIATGYGNTIYQMYARRNGGRGIYLSGTGNLSGSIAELNGGAGFYIAGPGFNVYNSESRSNNKSGFELSGLSYDNNIFNNLAYDNNGSGFLIGLAARANALYNNTARNNSGAGIRVEHSTQSNSIYGNRVYDGAGDGIYTGRTNQQNNFTNNTVFNNSGHGFFLNQSNYSLIIGNDVHDNAGAGVYLLGSSRNTVNGTKSYANDHGFHLESSHRNTIDLSNASSNTGAEGGFYISLSDYNNITNSNSGDNKDGFRLTSSDSNRIYNCNSSANAANGFNVVSGSSTNSLERCTASGNDASGFDLSSNQNTILVSTASENLQLGFSISSASNNITNSISFANFGHGFSVTGINNTLLNNTAYGHGTRGIYIRGNNTVDKNGHYYNNSYDYLIEPAASGFFINATNISIDNPSGGYANYTTLSFSDTAQAGEAYSIKWASIPSPSGRTSFRGKFVNITKELGTPIIDSMTWSWKASELTGYYERFLELWKHNASGWTMLSNSPNTTAHTFSLTNMNPASEYGILQTYCPVITSSGSYQLASNAVGAPNNASPIEGFACVKISASNVLFDCNGYNITDNGTALLYPTYGILISGPISNVTVQNCPGISNYKHGIYAKSLTYSVITGTNSYGNKEAGFRVDSSTNVYLLYNNASDNEIYGFHVYSGNANWLSNNNADRNQRTGYYIHSSPSNHLISNTATGSIENEGIMVFDSPSCTLDGNTARGSGMTGFYIHSSSNSILMDNEASDNSYYAVYINASTNITLSGMVISNQTYWIGPPGGSPIEIENLTAESGTSSVVFGSVNYSSGSALNESNLIIGDGFVALDSAARPEFNVSARITMWTPSCSHPRIYVSEEFPVTRYDVLREGRVCTECTVISCTGNTIVFDVPHFSGYAAGGENGLTIDNDGPKYANETITFNASYVNTTDASHIPGADCNLSLWNGSIYPMAENVDHYELSLNVTDIGAHDYNVTCSKAGFTTLTAFDTFTIFYNGTLSLVDIFGANVTVGSTGRYSSNITAGNVTIEGGNVSGVDLSSNESTDRWAAFYGNVTGSKVLAQSVDVQMIYVWLWNSSSGGVVCASTGPTPLSSIMGATYADIDAAWSFPPSSADSAANTFNNSNCSQRFGSTTVSNSYYADTGYSGGFTTCSWKSVAVPSKAEMLFCTNITYNGPLFNGQPGDYEIMVPTAYGTGVYETYYFYVNLA